MVNLNERQVGLKTGGSKYSSLKEFMDRVSVVRAPFNAVQVKTVEASFGDVIIAEEIPANAQIADNLKMSNGAYNSIANKGGIVTAEGTETTGFVTPGTFVAEYKTVLDDYGNMLNAVQIRNAANQDPILDSNGAEIFGLLIRAFGVADGAAIDVATGNVELVFAVLNSSGVPAAPSAAISASVEFSLNRVFALRYIAKISLEGANAVDVSAIAPGMSNPMTTQGDVIYGGALGAATRLAIGATPGMLLAVDALGTAPVWASIGTLFGLNTKGQMIIVDGTPAPAILGIGSAGQILTVVDGLPAWAANAGANATKYITTLTMTTGTNATGASLTLSAETPSWDKDGVSTEVSTPSKPAIADLAAFVDNNTEIYLNGILLDKAATTGKDVEFVSAGVIKFNMQLDIDDRITIKMAY